MARHTSSPPLEQSERLRFDVVRTDLARLEADYLACKKAPIEVQIMAIGDSLKQLAIGGPAARKRYDAAAKKLRIVLKKTYSSGPRESQGEQDLGNIGEGEALYLIGVTPNRHAAQLFWRTLGRTDPFPDRLWTAIKSRRSPYARALLVVAAATNRSPDSVETALKRYRRELRKSMPKRLPKFMREAMRKH
jgi:hypothetical protein